MRTPSSPTAEEWIRDRFELENAASEDFPIFRSLFLRQLAEINDEYGIDAVTDRQTLLEKDDPECGTCREFIENFWDNRGFSG